MKKAILWIVLILLILLAGASAAFVYFVVLPYQNAVSAMPENAVLTIQQDEQNNLTLTWPEAERADYYALELQLPMTQEAIEAEEEPTVLYRKFIHGTSCVLPPVPEEQQIVIQVSTVVEYEAAWETRLRPGDNPVRVTTTLSRPTLLDLQWTADPDTDQITVTYQPQSATHTRIYLTQEDGSLALLKTLTETETTFTFGDEQDIPMPAHGEERVFVFDTYRIEEGLEYYGYPCGGLTVVREDLLGRDLAFTVSDQGHNVYTMTWEETKGEYYELQQYNSDKSGWVTLTQIPKDGERTYTTGHLQNLSDFHFRVLAVGGQTQENSTFSAESEEITVHTGVSPIYCTIWPIKDLDAYSAPTGGEAVGKAKAIKAYCVLDEKDGMFGVMLDGKLCYIDSNYCLINLVEIFGNLCSYDITNSYASIYMVHEYEIPDVTDVVTAGYNYVQMANEEFLVPLLYPTSQKLLIAAQEAVSRGYRLKIYDAYRPNRATVEIYDLTEKILEDPIPEEPFTDKEIKDLPKVEEDEEITYELLMTNGTWQLGSFLAKGGSLHNLGIAVDLTLEDMNGEELEMQTSMHDLSHYSVLSKNNANAKLLAQIMSTANLGGLTSEWWHFQDNEARAQLKLPTAWSGVTPECWMADDHGWRYRRYNGTYFADCTREIGGEMYVFDAYGYAQKAE